MTQAARPSWWSEIFTYPSLLLALAIGILAVVNLAAWPILLQDTDLWYHLNSGRYLFAHLDLPRTSFFSFIDPPRAWVDYFWLFQALAYALFSKFGYYGLIALRVALFGATLAVLFRFLLAERERRLPVPWAAFLFICCCVILLPRALNVRPHLVTYLMIALFITVLEDRPQHANVLPLLAILWCNFHGIAYPLMGWILMAYGAEIGWRWLRRMGRHEREDRAVLGWMAACALAVLVTPHGLALLRMPFISTEGASRYVSELQPLQLVDLLSFQVAALAPSSPTVFNVLVIVCGLTLSMFIPLFTRRVPRPRLSHLLLCAGGLLLLLKGARFANECTLLALPLLRAHPLVPKRRILRGTPKPVYLFATALVMIMPLRYLAAIFEHRPAYPFSSARLPEGVVAFLNRSNVGGRVLNHPNNGGYLQWALAPGYQIFMDMEVPFLFTDADMQLVGSMFAKAEALGEVLERYHPSFITVLLRDDGFPAVIESAPRYRLVFFDDAEALYLDADQHPDLAARYALQALDPFALQRDGVESFLDEKPEKRCRGRAGAPRTPLDRVRLLTETERLLGVFDGASLINHLAGQLYLDEQAYEQVLPRAAVLIRRFPEQPNGYWLRGEALRRLGRPAEAVASYRAAFEKSPFVKRPRISAKIGLVYFQQGQYDKAYAQLKASVNVFDPETPEEDLFALGASARRLGRLEEASADFEYLERTLPADDTEWRTNLAEERAVLQASAAEANGR